MLNRNIILCIACTNLIMAILLIAIYSFENGIRTLHVISAYRELQSHGILRVETTAANSYENGKFRGAEDEHWTEIPYFLIGDTNSGMAAKVGAVHCIIVGLLLLYVWWRMWIHVDRKK